MTAVKITRRNRSIVRVRCDGHTNYAAHGEDIVCSALSSIVQTALLGLMQVAAISVEFKRDDKRGLLDFSLSEQLDTRDRNNADMILNTMLCGINDLAESFSDFIEVETDDL